LRCFISSQKRLYSGTSVVSDSLDAVDQSLMHLQDILQLGPHLILCWRLTRTSRPALIHDITILFKKNARRWPGMEFVKLLAIYLRIQFTKDYDIVHLAKLTMILRRLSARYRYQRGSG
jgi:hypothetical protein